MKILVTGGAGFIGSAVCRKIVHGSDDRVVNVDALTYAANLGSLEPIAGSPRYRFYHLNVCDQPKIHQLVEHERPDAILHLAAESHVDRSIAGPAEFINTNIFGTYVMLEAATAYWRKLDGRSKERFRFLHVSTDEVYGALGSEGRFTEASPYNPTSPYAASKASSDHLVRSWFRTYDLPTMTSNCSNNYGPYQNPEKLIPLMITNAIQGRELPVYGTGRNVRDWLYVDDHARALLQILRKGRPGESYNVGARNERSNLQVVHAVCDHLEAALHLQRGLLRGLIRFVVDRPGHDFRYAIDPSKIETEIGWTPRESFERGLAKTIDWYLDNARWWQPLRGESHDAGRQGLSPARSA